MRRTILVTVNDSHTALARIQVSFLRRNATYSWPQAHYPRGLPHLTAYCYLTGEAFCVVQERTRDADGTRFGYYATLYGTARPRVLTMDQFATFLRNMRPQDRCVVLDGFTESVSDTSQYMHYSERIVVAAADDDNDDDEGDEPTARSMVRELRYEAWKTAASAPERVRHLALALLERDGSLVALEIYGIASGSTRLFSEFANGADDAELWSLIKGPKKPTAWGVVTSEDEK